MHKFGYTDLSNLSLSLNLMISLFNSSKSWFRYIVSNFDMNGVNATEILVANRAGHYLSSANADYSQVGKNWTLPGITASWQSVDFLNGGMQSGCREILPRVKDYVLERVVMSGKSLHQVLSEN